MRNSIQQRLLLALLIILILAGGISAGWSYYHARSIVRSNSEELAYGCNELISNLLDQVDIDVLIDPSQVKLRDQYNRFLSTLCKSTDMEYLYVYMVDPDPIKRDYLLVAADDDEKVAAFWQGLADDQVETTPLQEAEKQALYGDEEVYQLYLDNEFGKSITYVSAYRDESEEVRALIGVDCSVPMMSTLTLQEFRDSIIPILLTLIAVFLFLLFLVRKELVTPIRELSSRMMRFAETHEKQESAWKVHPESEIQEMAASFDRMSEEISNYVADIEEMTRKELETGVQEETARKIQNGLVPEHLSLTGPGFAAEAFANSAKAVGGDFYDLFRKDETHICAVVGDVSGKNISAALFMSMAKTMIREKILAGASLAKALRQANEELCGMNPEGLFATVFAAELNLATGELIYANAGHTRPVLMRAASEYLIPNTGVMLGLFDDADILQESIRLNPGEGLLLYTDGITEAVRADKTFFGEDRLLAACTAADPKQLIEQIHKSVDDFSAGCEQFDDLTMLALFYEPTKAEILDLPVDLASFDLIRKRLISDYGNTTLMRQVLLACDELLTNIVSYSGATFLQFEYQSEGNVLRTVFRDNGIAFDPTATPEISDDPDSLDNLDQGGMGISMARQAADSMTYTRESDRNILSLTFQL